MKSYKSLALVLVILLASDCVWAGKQSVAVQGTLTCDGKPAVGVVSYILIK